MVVVTLQPPLPRSSSMRSIKGAYTPLVKYAHCSPQTPDTPSVPPIPSTSASVASQAAHESTLDLNLNAFPARTGPPSPPPIWPRSISPPPRVPAALREFRRANGHIKRPSNAFMLFRSHVTKQKDYAYNHDSKMIGEWL